MAPTLNEDERDMCKLLLDQREQLVRRVLIAWERSPETFGEEIVALNDIDETLRNHCSELIDKE